MDLSENDLKDLRVSLEVLSEALNQRKIYFPESDILESLTFCLRHHQQHLSTLGVAQGSIDPLKVITWFGVDLAMKDQDRMKQILECTVAALNVCLIFEASRFTKKEVLPAETLRYIIRLACNEFCGKSEHGIGKNGLFLCFHTAQKSLISCTK
jgi:hypothetical protein